MHPGQLLPSFLPTWEGVSAEVVGLAASREFPPYMGGYIGTNRVSDNSPEVSSLYGRVYRKYKR